MDDSRMTSGPPQQQQPPPTRERLPLKTSTAGQQGSKDVSWLPASNETHFWLIVVGMTVFALLTTVGLLADIARDPTQLVVHRGTVYAEVDACSAIGRRVLWDGGSAVDAAVATFLCLTVASPHSASLGCGGFMLIVKPEVDGDRAVVDFREMAPSLLRDAQTVRNEDPNGSKVAVPGVLRGLQVAHDRFGKLPWSRLVIPAADLAKNGFRVTEKLSKAILRFPLRKSALKTLLSFKGVPVKTGDVVTWQTLATTLRTIAEEGPEAFYSGNLTDTMVEELAVQGGSLSRKDFEAYSAVIDSPLEISIGGGTKLLVPPLPSSGPALGLVLAMMSALNDTKSADSPLRYHHLIEAIKLAMTAVITAGSPSNATVAHMESENLLRSSVVTELLSHIKDDSTIALNSIPILRMPTSAATVLVESDGTLVALVGTLGSVFGSQVVTSNGVLFGDAMDDFFPRTSAEDYKNNFYAPGRRPLSPIAVAALLSEAESNASCSVVRLLGASADFQLLAQADLVRMWRMDADVLERPKFWAALSRSSGGDVAIQGKDPGLSARLIDQLHELGHMIYDTDIVPAPIASLRYGQQLATVVYSDSAKL